MPSDTAGEVTSRGQLFERDGFLHIKGFASKEECARLKNRMKELIDAWDPSAEQPTVFVTDTKQQLKHQGSSDYFLDSADRIHFFFEKGATNEDGSLKKDVAKHRALNKVGHGLHVADDAFKEYSHCKKVTELVKDLGWTDPVLPQSMYIFKQPSIGGEVTSHQDSSFLHTTPKPTCLGLWLALDAATLENGCLWARPGSHKEPVRRVFVRNPDRFEKGDAKAPQMIFENLNSDCKAWDWEGKMPSGWTPPSMGLKEKGFQHVECEVGDLVVIHGQVDHMSLPNKSDKPRETFQLHLIEGPGEGITWSPRNWLQYPEGKSFPSLLAESERKKRKADQL
mmetsp:Transcript_59215/g.105216  ORF Transcript_59215/g.105216 Transcript_59215/m.105216 type:complete len:338 (+) Transcript_59215:51-1064(+)